MCFNYNNTSFHNKGERYNGQINRLGLTNDGNLYPWSDLNLRIFVATDSCHRSLAVTTPTAIIEAKHGALILFQSH